MGQDKGLMVFQGKPMILKVLEAVKDVVEEIILVLRDEEQFMQYEKVLEDFKTNFAGNIHISMDIVKDQGPLAGILTGLLQISSDYALAIPCDSPFISRSFLERMFGFEDDFDAVVPKWSDGRLEPLHSLYNRRIVVLIKQQLDEEKRDVKSLFKYLRVKYVEAESLDETGRTFWNINRPQDITKIR